MLGVIHTALVEPRVNYAVARATRSFRGGHSAVGVIATSVNRTLDDSTSAALLGSAAYSGGIDVRHQFAKNVYEAIASLVGTYVSGSPGAIGNLQRSTAHLFQRPDVIGVRYDSTRTSLWGLGAEAKLDKIAGHWRGGVDLSALSPGFDVNDAGFEDAADVQSGGAYLSYDEQRPGRRVRNWHAFVNQNWSRNIGGERLSHGGQIGVRFELTNNLSGSAFLNRDEYGLSVTESRGGPAIVTPPRTGLYVFLRGDDRRPLGWSVSANATNEEQTGGTAVSVSPALTGRLSDRLSFSLAPTVSRIINPWQYVTTASATAPGTRPAESPIPRYVFGRVDQTSASLTVRGTFIATPRLSLELYARPFVSTGNYSSFRELDRARSHSFNARLRLVSTTEVRAQSTPTQYRVADPDSQGFVFSNPDVDVVAFQSNAVLRWEYRPGSVLFLVWSQGRNQIGADGVLDVVHATRQLLRLPPTNVLLLKMSYWVGR